MTTPGRPDDALLRSVSRALRNAAATVPWRGQQRAIASWDRGISQRRRPGTAWHDGGMQDWNYVWRGGTPS